MAVNDPNQRMEQTPEVPPERRLEQDRSFTGLFKELANEMTTLVRQEVELARAETSEKVSQATSGATALAVGGAIAFAGFLFLLLSAVYALAQVWQPWVAALVVGGVVAIIGLIAVGKGRSNLKAQNLKLQRTSESLKRDKDMAQRRMQ